MATASCHVRVRYAETDKMAVAYYANYFVWFEVGRCELLRSLGGTYRQMEDAGMLLPVVEAHCNFRSPARYDDDLYISTTGLLRSRARIEFHYEVRRQTDRQLLATGHTVHAATNAAGRPRRIPTALETMLT